MEWNKFPVDFTHVCEKDESSYTSTIDHFIWSENMDDSITDSGVLHLPNNFSDHCPIFCKIKVNGLKLLADTVKPNYKPKPSWNTASPDQKSNFSDKLEQALIHVAIDKSLIECNDVHCKDQNHHKHSDNAMSDILKSVDTMAARRILGAGYRAFQARRTFLAFCLALCRATNQYRAAQADETHSQHIPPTNS